MASDGIVSRDVLRAILEQRRTGNGAAIETLEKIEPDLSEYLLEELGQIHKHLLDSGASARSTRRLYRRVETLVIVAVLSLRQAHARLWQKEEPPYVTPSPEAGPRADAQPAPPTMELDEAARSAPRSPPADTAPSRVRPATCPKCGGDRVLFLENVPLKRRVLGVYEDGRLSIHGFYVALDELGEGHRLACEGCDHEWPVDLNICEFF